VYFALMLSIAAAMWGTDIISKEERDKTVEFALTLPVTRSRVVTAKALAAVVNCIALLLVTWAISLASSSQYNPDGEFFRFLALCMGAIFILQLIFLAIGILLGCAMNRYKRTSSVAVSLLLGAYVLSVVSGLHKNLEFLKYVTPFKYFDAGLLLRESRFDLGFVALSAAIILVSMVGAYLTYNRRDLYMSRGPVGPGLALTGQDRCSVSRRSGKAMDRRCRGGAVRRLTDRLAVREYSPPAQPDHDRATPQMRGTGGRRPPARGRGGARSPPQMRCVARRHASRRLGLRVGTWEASARGSP
jgi:ABC-2 type transport system permease protein